MNITLNVRKIIDSNKKPILALLFSLIAGFIVISLVSESPLETFLSFIGGPISRVNRIGDWIEEFITLTLLGLSVAIVFKGEQFSLGAEGQLNLGSLAAGIVALYLPVPAILRVPTALLASMIVGFLFGLIPGILKAKMNANEIVSTLMLNAIAIKLYEIIVVYSLTPKEGATFAASLPFPKEGILPFFLPNIPFLQGGITVLKNQTSISIALYITIIIVFLVYFFMSRTTHGYEIRMSGLNKDFAFYGGLNVERSIILSMAISGAVAGLAGAHISMAIHERLLLGISVGIGFEGVVVALLARNNPILVPFAALVYSYIRIGADVMERSSDVPREIVVLIQGIIILSITAERSMPLLKDVLLKIKRKKKEVS